MGISVVLLAYKEADNLRVLLPQIIDNVQKTGEPFEILVVDTREPLDDTRFVCEVFGCRYINQELPGFGGAFKTGIHYAKYDKFLIMDSDGSHDPQYIPAIYNRYVADKCDLVIGSRYVKGGHTQDARSSIVMSKTLNFVYRLALGIPAKDLSTDYRMYDTAQLKRVRLSCQNYDVLEEVLLKLNLGNPSFKIGEVPISFVKRMYGESKRRLLPFIFSYMKSLFYLLCVRFSYKRQKRAACKG